MKLVVLNRIICGTESNLIVFVLSESPITSCDNLPSCLGWDNTKCVRLPDSAGIFRAELYALLLAIDVVRRSKEKNFVIFSDSMSSLQPINGFNLDSDLVQKFMKDYTILAKMVKTLFTVGSQVMWESSVMKKQMQLPNWHSPYLSPVWSFLLIFDKWQEVWNCCAGNKLHAIRLTVGDYKQKTCLIAPWFSIAK